jgi:intein/homing endonuclease
MNLTFGDLKAIIKGALNGNLELAREKCVYGDAIIQTEKNGEMTLKEFVDGNVDDKVLAYDELTHTNEYKNVIAKMNNDDTDEWLEIELEDGKIIQVTPNHRIYVDGTGYVQAKDLTNDMELKVL